MVIVAPIPARRNATATPAGKGIALKCNEFTTLAYKIDGLLDQPAQLAAMRERALAYSRPNAPPPSSTRSSISRWEKPPGRARRNVISSQPASLKYVGPFSPRISEERQRQLDARHLYGCFLALGKRWNRRFRLRCYWSLGGEGYTIAPSVFTALRFSAFLSRAFGHGETKGGMRSGLRKNVRNSESY